jgi:hypothetical protein
MVRIMVNFRARALVGPERLTNMSVQRYIAHHQERTSITMDRKISLFSESAWCRLAEATRERLPASSSFSEEDLRHSVVAALESVGMFPKGAVRLNYKHPAFDRKKVDLYLLPYSGQNAIACELKYDRAIPSGGNQARSMRAGALLNDVFRLAHFKETTDLERFLIYLTDQEMLNYLRNPKNGFDSLVAGSDGPTLTINSSFLVGRAKSVTKMIRVPQVRCSVSTILGRNIGQDHHLFVWFVLPLI